MLDNNISSYNLIANINVASPTTKSTTTPLNANEDSATVSPQQAENALIIESLSVSISSKNSPMPLLSKSVISRINEALEKTYGPNAIENAYDNKVDVSPEATADRIVSYATGFYSAYRQQHPELDDQSARSNFVDLMSNAVDKGFEEAKSILKSLDVLQGSIAKNIEQTYNLVQDGLAEFLNEGNAPSAATNSGKNTAT